MNQNHKPIVLYEGILRQDESLEEMILPELPKNVNTITESEGKAALIWILGEYGEVRSARCDDFVSAHHGVLFIYCSYKCVLCICIRHSQIVLISWKMW